MNQNKIGIIGGSGLYQMDGFENTEWVDVETPFGSPSDSFLSGQLADREVVFLPRHGRGHRILPGELNHRANIWGMKSLGVSWIISASAVGSLKEDYAPTDMVMINQFFDRTRQSPNHTFFGNGIAAHIAFAFPIDESLRTILLDTAKELGVTAHDGGTYVNMEGPAFSTLAESEANRHLGFDVIGMTNLGEAKCAREAEIAYATMAMVTDYDCWKQDEDPVEVEMVIANLKKNATNAQSIIKSAIRQIPQKANWSSHGALKNAIMTQRDLWPEDTVEKLKPIISKYL